MPDYYEPAPSNEMPADWASMVHDLETRVETLSDALEGVKLSMRRLVAAEPWNGQSGLPGIGAEAGLIPAQDVDPVYEPEAEPASKPPAHADYDEDAREAVRRAVEEAKAQMAAGNWQDDPEYWQREDFGLPSEPEAMPEVIWAVNENEAPPEPEPAEAEPVQATAVDDEEAREAVRRAVEELRAEMAQGDLPADDIEPVAHDDASLEAEHEVVADSEAEPASGSEDFALPDATEVTWAAYEPAEPQAEFADTHAEAVDDEAREAVRRAVEELKAEMAQGNVPEAELAPADDEEAAREAVRRAVEEAKAEMGFASQSPAPAATPVDDEEAAREAVRRAVMQARTEMATTGSLSEEPPEPVEVAPAYVVPPPHRAERAHPPTITIEDPEGRVELARVYNLLKALDCAANSSLLNYSARQVSVQLSDNQVPPGVVVAEAVKNVFEREPDVQVDGVNVIVKLGNDYIRAA